jgi:hemolysin III
MARPQRLGEEVANSITHGVGALLALAGTVTLIVAGARMGDPVRIVAVSIYGATMVMLYLSSTLYHALAPNRAKAVFRVLDHASIYLLIAGTYTPFMLLAFRGARGTVLLATVWSLAVLGTTLDACIGARVRRVSLFIYLAMGWMVLLDGRQLLEAVGAGGMAWLVAGGVAYTAGAAFYAAKRVLYAHVVWHLFVIAGTSLHFVAVYRLVAEAPS